MNLFRTFDPRRYAGNDIQTQRRGWHKYNFRRLGPLLEFINNFDPRDGSRANADRLILTLAEARWIIERAEADLLVADLAD